ncbi:hypothetical protein BURK1_01135 [Burkholderiales bacterium]|nr:hypothetical protein BURK1_01135 [Burkholderiales bacterium]
MSRIDSTKTAIAALAAAFAMALAAPALAQVGGHAHDQATPAKLALDHGRKWPTDAPLREGMTRIRALVAPQLAAAHAGRLTPGQYRDVAGKVEGEVAGIVANCKLAPEADAMLHLVIADLVHGADVMAGKEPNAKPLQGLGAIVAALGDYGRYFDHPGFEPISAGH